MKNQFYLAKITTGNYNTKDYSVIKTYSSEKPLRKFLKSIKFPYDELLSETWNCHGKQYKLSIDWK